MTTVTMKNQEMPAVVVLSILIITEEMPVKISMMMMTMNHQETINLISMITVKQQRDLAIKIEIEVMINMVKIIIAIEIGTMAEIEIGTETVVQVQESTIRISLLLDPLERLLAQTPTQAEAIHIVTNTVIAVNLTHMIKINHTENQTHMATEEVDQILMEMEEVDQIHTAIQTHMAMEEVNMEVQALTVTEEVVDLKVNLKSVEPLQSRS